MAKKVEEHAFSIEMNGRFVKRMSYLSGEADHFFFEGFLGQLESFSMVEGLMLEIVGTNGVLRVDIYQQEIAGCVDTKKALEGKQ